MQTYIHRLHLRLHAVCPKCEEYRSNTILSDGKDKIILVCECEHEHEKKEDTNAQAAPRRDTSPVL